MSIIKWETNRYDEKIGQLECTRETKATVWYLEKNFRFGASVNSMVERKASKKSEYTRIHDSWEAAHAYLLERANQKVTNARSALQRAQDALGNVKGMKKP